MFPHATAFDAIRDAFRLIDHGVDPCENFYRHACPISELEFYVEDAYKEKLVSLAAKSADTPWKNLEIEKTFKKTHFDELPTPIEVIGKVFRSQCENLNITVAEREQFLLTAQQSIFGFENNECEYDGCLIPLVYDKNCSRAEQTLINRMPGPTDPLLFTLQSFAMFERRFELIMKFAKMRLNAVNAILDSDITSGVSKIKDLIVNLVDKLTGLIKDTPWAINNGAVDSIINEAQQVHLYDNFGKTMRGQLNYVYELEQKYLKCLTGTVITSDLEVACMVMASFKVPVDETFPKDFYTYFNAMNSHPDLYFSYILYDMAVNVEEFAAVLGSVGFVAGHEVSHTMIEDANSPVLIPYFSNDSMQCIQGQYQKTCDSFQEISCQAEDNQIDENGADILGMRLAHSLLEDAYEDNIDKVYLKLPDRNITMHQLFFYSTAFVSCSGFQGEQIPRNPHSPWNIRINAIMQHPGFRNAFQCSPDTKMAKSFADECIIFGENAPEIRR